MVKKKKVHRDCLEDKTQAAERGKNAKEQDRKESSGKTKWIDSKEAREKRRKTRKELRTHDNFIGDFTHVLPLVFSMNTSCLTSFPP